MNLPGHEYVFNDHRKRIAELFNHNQQKAEEIRKSFDTDLKQTAYEVASEIFHKQTDTFWDKMTGWDKRFAILQTIAHLESWRFEHVLSQRNIYQ